MPLPHPHGAASGEIGHNAAYDTGIVPGSTGGKFIGFGEQGTSAIGNRAHWALSENIDYLYDAVAGDKSLPAGMSHLTINQGSGGQQTLEIPDEVFVGDATYPGTNGVIDDDYREGMLLLFAVLDDQYNELTDGSGNEIRVQEVRDSGDVTDQYKLANPTWTVNPILRFNAVNPVTGAVVGGGNYIIPTGTNIRILYGYKGTMENMPVDMFTRFKVNSATEVEAGALLQDGTREMTGNLNFDGNDAINLDEVKGAAGEDLTVYSAQHLELTAAQEMKLKDNNLLAAVNLSQSGVDSLYSAGLYSSIVGGVNSSLMESKWFGNRVISKGGDTTFVGATGTITIAAGTTVSLNGEGIDVGGKSFIATDSVLSVGVIDASGDFIERAGTLAAVLDTDVLICAHNWDDTGNTFTVEYDYVFPIDKGGNLLPFTVGNMPGCMFTDMREALETVNRMNVWHPHTKGRLIICGDATFTGTSITLFTSLCIEGLRGTKHDRITFSQSTDTAIECANNIVHIKDMAITFNSFMSPEDSEGCFKDPGLGSRFSNLVLVMGSYDTFIYIGPAGIGWDPKLGGQTLIDSVHMETGSAGFLVDTNLAAVNVVVRNCSLGSTGLLALRGAFNTVENCGLAALYIGPGGYVHGNNFMGDTSYPSGDWYGAINLEYAANYWQGTFLDGIAPYKIINNTFANYRVGVDCTLDAGDVDVNIQCAVSNNVFKKMNYSVRVYNIGAGSINDNMAWTITGNHFDEVGNFSIMRRVFDLRMAKNVNITGNVFTDCTGAILEPDTHNKILFKGNIVRQAPGSSTILMTLADGNNGIDEESVLIEGNIFEGSVNVPIIKSHASTPADNVAIRNNIFNVPGQTHYTIEWAGSPIVITGNSFISNGTATGGAVKLDDELISGSVVDGNYLKDVQGIMSSSPHTVIYIDWITTEPQGCSVSNNRFFQCGSRAAASQTSTMIRVEGEGMSVCDNVFTKMYGPQFGATGTTECIGMFGDSMNASRNTFSEDFDSTTTTRRCSGSFSGIYINGGYDHRVHDNVFAYSGNFASSNGGETCIYANSPRVSICNNYGGAGTRTTGYTNYLIRATGAYNAINNNVSRGGMKIDATLSNYSTINSNTMFGSAAITVSGTRICMCGNSLETGNLTATGSGGIVNSTVINPGAGHNTGSHLITGNSWQT